MFNMNDSELSELHKILVLRKCTMVFTMLVMIPFVILWMNEGERIAIALGVFFSMPIGILFFALYLNRLKPFLESMGFSIN